MARDELDQEFSRAGRVTQRSFSSWDALVESYLAGFRAWVDRTGRDGSGNEAFRREIYERLKRQSFSPYHIPWDTDLSWMPGVSGGAGRRRVRSFDLPYPLKKDEYNAVEELYEASIAPEQYPNHCYRTDDGRIVRRAYCSGIIHMKRKLP